jgi:hypothetical protein
MIEFIVPPIWCAIADRVRGGFPDARLFDWVPDKPYTGGLMGAVNLKPAWVDHVRHAVKFTYGAALVLPFTQTWWHLVLAGITWKFGEQIASDFGGTFRLIAGKDKWLTPLLRVGAVWPIATIVALGYVVPSCLFLLPVSMVATVISAILASSVFNKAKLTNWILQLSTPAAWQEALRGFINGSLAALLGWLTTT